MAAVHFHSGRAALQREISDLGGNGLSGENARAVALPAQSMSSHQKPQLPVLAENRYTNFPFIIDM